MIIEDTIQFINSLKTAKIIVDQSSSSCEIEFVENFIRVCEPFLSIDVSGNDEPKRSFTCEFTLTTSEEFSELQLHRKPFAVITIEKRHSQNGSTISGLDQLKENYAKNVIFRQIRFGEIETTLRRPVDREVVDITSLDDAELIATTIRDLVREIYIVIEKTRVDLSFENKNLEYPMLPGEHKYNVGIDSNKGAKVIKKKAQGRCEKQFSDLCLLVGLPSLALDGYRDAIENLGSASDFLWLAAAQEGHAAATTIVFIENVDNEATMRKTKSMANISRNSDVSIENNNTSLSVTANLGHSRHHSDEVNNITKSQGSSLSSNSFRWSVREETKKKFRTPFLNNPDVDLFENMVKTFKKAIEGYGKFSTAIWIEYECVMRLIASLMIAKKFSKLENVHRDYIGKFLDDANVSMGHEQKAEICLNSAEMYAQMNFYRKRSFYTRLSVLFELHVPDGVERNYAKVYPHLYRSLAGYGIDDTMCILDRSSSCSGPVKLQIKVMNELYTASNRAGFPHAAIRHICYILESFSDALDEGSLARLINELENLASQNPGHSLDQELVVGTTGITLPTLEMTTFPKVTNPTVLNLTNQFAPKLMKSGNEKSIFIYTPFQTRDADTTLWVTDCPGEVDVTVVNNSNSELIVRDLRLMTSGISFESVPARLILPPKDLTGALTTIRLIGVPRAAGDLFINGYECTVFNVKNACFFREDQATSAKKIRVVPKLARLNLECSLPRAPMNDLNEEPSSEATVYSGQCFTHTVTVVNDSDVDVHLAKISIEQPVMKGGPPLIKLNDEKESRDGFSLKAHSRREISFQLFGVDPTATTEDMMEEDKVLETVVPLASAQLVSTVEEAESDDIDLIPYTGRLLICQFIVQYQTLVVETEEILERTTRLQVAINIIPAVTVSAWHVLPGDSMFSRYIGVDVTNSTDNDAELIYSDTRCMNVLPKDTCRVPLLSPCCTEVVSGSFHQARQKGSYMMQKIETERLRQILEAHVCNHLNIKWNIPTLKIGGSVPVGSLLSSVSLLKQLVLPAISLDFIVNNRHLENKEDVSVKLGDVVNMDVIAINSLQDDFIGILSLECEQEISQQIQPQNVSNQMIIISNKRVMFTARKHVGLSQDATSVIAKFSFVFRTEGNFRVRPIIATTAGQTPLLQEDMFATPIAFNVSSKF